MKNRISKPISFFGKVAVGLVLALQLCSANAAVAPLSVSGNKVLIGGQEGSLAGNSFFWSNTGYGCENLYTAGAVASLKSVFKSTLVRAAMGIDEQTTGAAYGGYVYNNGQFAAENKARVKTVVDAAIANDVYVIIDWHAHNAERFQAQSIAFFEEMARTYGSQNNVIYEIYNEPLVVSWSGVVKPYAIEVIKAIRAIDPDNLIIVGTPTWSQDVDVAMRDPITGYANIAYTLHFYAAFEPHQQKLRLKAQEALDGADGKSGIALFVTEWGSVLNTGDGAVDSYQTDLWMDFLKANKISHANWSVCTKNEGASLLKAGASLTGGWPDSVLTDSGKKVKSIISNWPAVNQANPGSKASSSVGTTTKSIPVTIQAESYIAMSGVQTEATSDTGGGLNVGWTDAGDSMNYSNTRVNIPANGTYKITYRVASLNGGGSFAFKEAGGATYDNVPVPKTSGWQSWTDVTRNVTLTAGVHQFAVAVTAGGFNLNWFRIESGSVAASSKPKSSSAASSAGGGTGGVKCEQISNNEWNTGFTAAIRITNNRSTDIVGWSLTFKYNDATRVNGTEVWNAKVVGANPYTATPIWSATIKPGQSAEFGFNAVKGGSAVSVPTFGGICN